jgi:hypothetical protein
MPELKLLQTNVNDDKYPFCWIILPPGMVWFGDTKITTELRYMDTVQEIFTVARYEIEKRVADAEPWKLLLYGLNDIDVWFVEEIKPDMRYLEEIKWRRMTIDEVVDFVESGMTKMGFKTW